MQQSIGKSIRGFKPGSVVFNKQQSRGSASMMLGPPSRALLPEFPTFSPLARQSLELNMVPPKPGRFPVPKRPTSRVSRANSIVGLGGPKTPRRALPDTLRRPSNAPIPKVVRDRIEERFPLDQPDSGLEYVDLKKRNYPQFGGPSYVPDRLQKPSKTENGEPTRRRPSPDYPPESMTRRPSPDYPPESMPRPSLDYPPESTPSPDYPLERLDLAPEKQTTRRKSEMDGGNLAKGSRKSAEPQLQTRVEPEPKATENRILEKREDAENNIPAEKREKKTPASKNQEKTTVVAGLPSTVVEDWIAEQHAVTVIPGVSGGNYCLQTPCSVAIYPKLMRDRLKETLAAQESRRLQTTCECNCQRRNFLCLQRHSRKPPEIRYV